MNALRVLVILALVFFASTAAAEPRFVAVDVYVISDKPLAAWQFSFEGGNAGLKVVGIENGDAAVFEDAPYYDRQAVAAGTADRVVVADYSLADVATLPIGRVRVATLHLMLNGDEPPDFDAHLAVAATYGGKHIEAKISLEISSGSEQ